MLTIHAPPRSDQSDANNSRLLIMKGALERVYVALVCHSSCDAELNCRMPRCTNIIRRGEIIPLTPKMRQNVETACSTFAKKGQRVKMSQINNEVVHELILCRC